jgi:hypothetical protein
VIRRLRRRHLGFGLAALALAPIAVVVGARSRPAAPRNPALGAAGTGWAPVPELPIEARADSGSIAFRATGPIRVPDPLLYWTASAPQNRSIPARAVLIGSLTDDGERSVRVPIGALGPGGYFLIWDGGHGRVVAWAAADPPSRRGSTP